MDAKLGFDSYDEFDRVWRGAEQSSPKNVTLMANDVCSQHEHEFADEATFADIAALYGVNLDEEV